MFHLICFVSQSDLHTLYVIHKATEFTYLLFALSVVHWLIQRAFNDQTDKPMEHAEEECSPHEPEGLLGEALVFWVQAEVRGDIRWH